MKLLALDTALDACAVAVMDGVHVIATSREIMTRGHQEALAPMVQATMAAAGLGFADLDRVAVAIGPGSFTGLRVGLAFAKALALVLDIPCIGIGTLEALAASVPQSGSLKGPIAAVLDARRGQVYLQPFGADGLETAPPAALAVDAAVSRLAELGFGPGALLTGSGAALLCDDLTGVTIEPGAGVDIAAMGRLALARPAPRGRPQPLYLRAPDARTLVERAASTA